MKTFRWRDLGDWGMAIVMSVGLHVLVLSVLFLISDSKPSEKTDKPSIPEKPTTEENADKTLTEPVPAGDNQADEKKSDTAKTVASKKTTDKPQRANSGDKTKNGADTKPLLSEDGAVLYEIKKGDNASRLARSCGCTTDDIAKLNHISLQALSKLRVGQTIKLPKMP